MNYWTDENIPIDCPECDRHTEEGLKAMIEHILAAHPEYTPHEADACAVKWMEGAYDRLDEEKEAYSRDRAYEKRLNRARGKE